MTLPCATEHGRRWDGIEILRLRLWPRLRYFVSVRPPFLKTRLRLGTPASYAGVFTSLLFLDAGWTLKP
jgi:hypothetical protein